MSTQEDSFHFPFITNLMGGKIAARSSLHQRRTLSMKEMALCLDDDPLSLRLVEHLLKKRYDVVSCATMDKAITAVQKYDIGLFLCDYHLGEQFTGSQAYESLREDYGYAPVHRVLITSYPSSEIETEALASGFDRVFSKPLRKEFQMYCLNLRMPRFKNPLAAGQ